MAKQKPTPEASKMTVLDNTEQKPAPKAEVKKTVVDMGNGFKRIDYT
jgi:hypothetical protein